MSVAEDEASSEGLGKAPPKKSRITTIAVIIVVIMIIGATIWLIARSIERPFEPPPGYAEHTTIWIGGDSDFIPDNGVVGGNGTAADPYLIAGWYIRTSVLWDGAMAGIQIMNANVHFTVRDCYVSTSASNRDWGFYLNYCANGTLENNNCSGNEYGIYLGFSSSITIGNNSCFSNQIGIVLSAECTNNTIVNNTCSNGGSGISLSSSSSNTLIDNCIRSNSHRGIYLNSHCIGNEITRNEISSNGGYSIVISSGLDNLIHGNAILHNNGVTSTYNASRTQAYDDSSENSWYVSGETDVGGNYWSDLVAPDVNDDGVVDDSYMIAGNAGAEDCYPLTYNPL
jgi:parallel beta-helix repeat protein